MDTEDSRTRRHFFISHHHADDSRVDQLTDLLVRAGNDVRNSSVRMKPANQRRFEEGRVSDETIRRVLRMKISWATTVVVLVGKETYERPWVNWEIEQAHKQGKRIIGIYEPGGTDVPLPKALEDYGTRVVAWNTDSIVEAIESENNPFENPDGSPREPVHLGKKVVC
jgi:hypothetical protein